jgi:protein-tyrosine phosphatase
MHKVSSILFVCMGNICRSPSGEAMMKSLAKNANIELKIESAGTINFHQGKAPDPRSIAAGEKRGLSFKGMQARQVNASDFERFDLILAADNNNMADLTDQCPEHLRYKLNMMLAFTRMPKHQSINEVPDPYYGAGDGFEVVLNLLEDSCQGLIEAI